MAKGNRTNHKNDNTKEIVSLSQRYSEEVDEYKRFAIARRENRKYTQESLAVFYHRLTDYVEDCKAKNQPLTVADILLSTGIKKDLWSKAKNGELDYLLEECIVVHNISEDDIVYDDQDLPWTVVDGQEILLLPWSEFREKADLMVQAQLERNCYVNKGNPVGSIFGLKGFFGVREDEPVQTQNNTLIVADREKATELLEMAMKR